MFEMAKSSAGRERALWVAYFILGLAVPLIIWNRQSRRAQARLHEIDEAHDITVEDSFPASDPPSAW